MIRDEEVLGTPATMTIRAQQSYRGTTGINRFKYSSIPRAQMPTGVDCEQERHDFLPRS